MRPLNEENEKGAVTVMVALLMVVLIGFAALAIDIAALYQERQALQNGADAGALAVAKDCAGAGCGGFTGRADQYADLNADDGNSNVDEVCGTGPGLSACRERPTVPAGARYVQVITSTFEVASPGNPTEVNFNFAPVFDLVVPGDADDHDGRTMRARAVAAWGSPSDVTTLPLTISRCEFDGLVPTLASLLGPFTVSSIFHGPTSLTVPCPTSRSLLHPGGFSWIDTGSDCEVPIALGDWVDREPGNSAPDCLDVSDLVNTTVMVPINDDTRGGSLFSPPDEYRIVGFAAFHISGYRLPEGTSPPGQRCLPLPLPLGGGTCLRGYFTRLNTTGTGFGGPDMGVTIIKLVG